MQGSSVPRLISDLLKLLSICAFLKHLKILNSKFYGTNYTLAKFVIGINWLFYWLFF